MKSRLRGAAAPGTVRLDADGKPFYLYGDVKVPVKDDTPDVALHANPGFEDETAGVPDVWYLSWQVNGSAVSSTAEAMAESHSALVTLSGAGSQHLLTDVLTVLPGDVIEFWIFGHKGSGAPTIHGSLLTRASGTPDYFDEPDTKDQHGAAHVLTDTYEKYSQSFTVPSGHTVARLAFVVEAPGAATAYLDSSGSRKTVSSTVENVVYWVPLPANVDITSTSGAAPDVLTGLSVTLDAPGMSAVYVVEVDAVLAFGAAVDCVVLLFVDGVQQVGAPVVSAAAGRYATAHRKWTVKELSSGSHTFSAKAYLSGAATVVAAMDNTVMHVTRMQ